MYISIKPNKVSAAIILLNVYGRFYLNDFNRLFIIICNILNDDEFELLMSRSPDEHVKDAAKLYFYEQSVC